MGRARRGPDRADQPVELRVRRRGSPASPGGTSSTTRPVSVPRTDGPATHNSNSARSPETAAHLPTPDHPFLPDAGYRPAPTKPMSNASDLVHGSKTGAEKGRNPIWDDGGPGPTSGRTDDRPRQLGDGPGHLVEGEGALNAGPAPPAPARS